MSRTLTFVLVCIILLLMAISSCRTVKAQTNTSVLNGTVRLLYTNTDFFLIGPTNYSLTNGQSLKINVRFSPTRFGWQTNYAIFESNGGNSTNIMTGKGTEPGPTNLRITKSS
jgi:hypothetical protein